MGPGYFPTLLSALIIALGVVVAFRGLTVEGPPIETIHVRLISFIIAATADAVEAIGLALTAILLNDLICLKTC